MLRLDTNPVFKDALETFGYGPQVRKAIEELAELTVATLHYYDNRATHMDVATEVADVLIMCHQLARVVGEDNVMTEYVSKIERLKERIKEVRSGRTA